MNNSCTSCTTTVEHGKFGFWFFGDSRREKRRTTLNFLFFLHPSNNIQANDPSLLILFVLGCFFGDWYIFSSTWIFQNSVQHTAGVSCSSKPKFRKSGIHGTLREHPNQWECIDSLFAGQPLKYVRLVPPYLRFYYRNRREAMMIQPMILSLGTHHRNICSNAITLCILEWLLEELPTELPKASLS